MQIIRVNLEREILTVRKLWKVNRKIERILLQLNKLTLDCRKESVKLELVTPSNQNSIPMTYFHYRTLVISMSIILYRFTTYETNKMV